MINRAIKVAVAILAVLAMRPASAQKVFSPCPEVLINEKYDHVPCRPYRAQGWDTVVSCAHPQIELSSEPYIPVQYFNGTYVVDTIPYAPADPTFSRGTRMPVTTDDDFAADSTIIPFAFYFFGLRKNAFVLGANGMVTFNTAAAGHGCAYRFSAPLPWPAATTGVPSTYGMELEMMRDAIYGVFEDTQPLASYLSGTQGIYYGVQDEFPCRKIICSWNGIPLYPAYLNQNNRCTYQIVCYEGSNIIEVHVKRRGVAVGDDNNGAGIIGIQNATGVNQIRDPEPGTSNHYIATDPPSPPFFSPAADASSANGYNLLHSALDSVAYRFTPQGTTLKECKWYRLFPNDSTVVLGFDPNDTNGYVSKQMSDDISSGEHPTLTKAVVAPRCVSRYVCELRFKNADTTWYILCDTITIGIDTLNDLRVKLMGAPDTAKVMDICQGHAAALSLVFPESLEADSIHWEVDRIYNGVKVPLDDSLHTLNANRCNLMLWPDTTYDSLYAPKVDSIWLKADVGFVSGCTNHDSALIRIFPNYDTVDREGICSGQSFTWSHNGQTYTTNTSWPQVTLATGHGCDSVVHLNLTVFDVSHTTDYVEDCKPITWLNGVTYTESNTATAATDTIVLQNLWGCDSVVSLVFTIHPLTAIIKSSLDNFDFDHLDVELTDVSIGNDYRVWKLPSASDQVGVTAYYTIPVEMDSAVVTLIVSSPYGCVDSARLVLPFNKETFWVPNIFTPDKADNNRFGSVSSQTLRQEMFIYARNGMLVFHCDGVDCQWDGNFADGSPCPQGAYAYVIRYSNVFEPAKTNIIKGSVTLLR